MDFNEYLKIFDDKLLNSSLAPGKKLYDYYTKFIEHCRKYGKKICLLYMVGQFYEVYSYTEKILINGEEYEITYGNADKITSILNMSLGRMNSNKKPSLENPNMGGFPFFVLEKHLDVLIDVGYTVVIYDQLKDKKSLGKDQWIRVLNRIVSPSTHIQDEQLVTTNRNNNLLCIYLEGIDRKNPDINLRERKFNCGIAMIDLSTGKSSVTEIYYSKSDNKKILDELYRILHSYVPIEMQVVYKNIGHICNGKIDPNSIKNLLRNYQDTNHIQAYYSELDSNIAKISYQDRFLGSIFTECGLLSPIQYIGLGMRQLACISYVSVLEFAYEHDDNIIKKVSRPNIIDSTEHLILENNAIIQLDMFTKTTNTNLFKILNKCSTSMGKRLLNQRLIEPIIDEDELNRRYRLIDLALNMDIKKIELALKKIIDIERLHRRITLGTLRPFELYKLHTNYKYIKDIIRLTYKSNLKELLPSKEVIHSFGKYLRMYEKYIDIPSLQHYTDFGYIGKIRHQENKNDNDQVIYTFIKSGINKDIDRYCQEINDTKKNIDNMCQTFSDIVDKTCKTRNKYLKPNNYTSVRLGLTEKSGIHLLTSKTRWKLLQKFMQDNKKTYGKYVESHHKEYLTAKTLSSNVKIESNELDEYSKTLSNNEELLKQKTRDVYGNLLSELDTNFNNTLQSITNFIAELDIISCAARLASVNNYCQPQIVNHEKSFIDAKKIRNPIVEKLIDTIYIANDITLGRDIDGMILYGFNSVGKSCLLKGICLNIIMAQAGLYVAAESFQYHPYHNIFTRLPGSDNIFVGHSSFICELMDLKSILTRSDNRTLCILDEITCSTENISGISISGSAIAELAEHNSTFIFATHYHELKNLDEIKNIDNVGIYHLDTQIKDGELIFNRKLKPGPSDELYGLLVAKNIIDNVSFQKRANGVKKHLLGLKETILTDKTSHFNANVFMDSCTICGATENLECHHINMQCSANDNGFINHFHKNNRGNLVVLCWKCHHKGVHSPDKKIVINGWKISTKYGRYLDYIVNDHKIVTGS